MSETNYDDVGFGSLFGSVGHFLGNASKVAGREIGHVSDSVQGAAGKVGSAISKVPIVGAPVDALFTMAYHTATAPARIAVDVAIKGKRIDKAFLGRIHEQVHDLKEVAPYAQMVISTVPGVGQGASAAIGTGLALAQGQPIDKALIAGVLSAVPGGPLAQAAASVAAAGVEAAVRGEKFDASAVAPMLNQLPIPPAAKEALKAGMQMTADIAAGKKVDAALADSALKAGMHYMPDSAKKAFQTGLGVQVAAVMQNVKAAHLPDIHGKLVESGIQLAKSVPAIGEARKLAGAGSKGFDLAHGLLSQKATLFDVAHIRNGITHPADKMGFDMALATRIGLVSHPPRHDLSPAASAGRAIAHGMQGMADPEHKKILMQHVQASPSATVGAKVAVAHIVAKRESWPIRIVKTAKAGFKQLMSGHS